MKKILTYILKIGTLWSTYALVGSVLLQIFARFFLEKAPPWTEEASRFFFIYATAFASGLALKNKYFVHLDLFYNNFSAKGKRVIDIAVPFTVLILFSIMTIGALQMVGFGHLEKSPSMGIQMSIAFFSIFILTISLSYYAFHELKKVLKHKRL